MTLDDRTRPLQAAERLGEFPPPPPLVDHHSVVRMAVEEIREMILSGKLRPGQRLLQDELTARLGISQPPFREAVRILESDGMVTVLPRRGAYVAALSDQDVFEILTLRTALERLAVELGVPCVNDKRIEECARWVGVMEKCAKRKDRAKLVEAGYQFHRAIVALAGHERVLQTWDSLHRQLLMCMAMNLYAREQHHEDLTEHVRRHKVLLDLIKAGDPQKVLAELAVHGERSFTEHREE